MNKNTPHEQSTTESEITALVDENARLLRELTIKTREVENLRASLYGGQDTAPETTPPFPTQGRQRKSWLLQEIKAIVAKAIKKPGMNTIKAPFRLCKLFLRAVRARWLK